MKKPFRTNAVYRLESAGPEDELREEQFHLSDYELYPIILDLEEVAAAEPCFIERGKVTTLFFKNGNKKWIMCPFVKIADMLSQPQTIFAKNN